MVCSLVCAWLGFVCPDDYLFGSISAIARLELSGNINASTVLPCNETALMSHEIMSTYAKLTGDWAGVVIDSSGELNHGNVRSSHPVFFHVDTVCGPQIFMTPCNSCFFWTMPGQELCPANALMTIFGILQVAEMFHKAVWSGIRLAMDGECLTCW